MAPDRPAADAALATGSVVLCIPTFRRPHGLARLLDHVARFNCPGPLSVLVVDNDAAVVAAMRALLEGWDCEVLVAHDAASAREACARDRPDLLVLDYHLDDGATGLALRAQLGASFARLPCIVVSAARAAELRRAVYASRDAAEGPRAFAEKRRPLWRGC